MECAGCGRHLVRKLCVSFTPPTEEERRGGILGWKKIRYFFRPWAVTVVTRIKTTTYRMPTGEMPISECAHACSRSCLDKVLETWTYDAKNWELRGFGRRMVKEGVRDVLAFVVGEGAPPAEPSDAWIEVGEKHRD